jgi:glutamate racemase
LDISGASDPLDAATRLSQDMGIFQMLSQDPMIMSDPVKHYYLLRKILEDAGTQNIEQIIGTAEEAMQMKQALQQQAQQQAAAGQPPQQGASHAPTNGHATPARN